MVLLLLMCKVMWCLIMMMMMVIVVVLLVYFIPYHASNFITEGAQDLGWILEGSLLLLLLL